jgi:hypothetical protein
MTATATRSTRPDLVWIDVAEAPELATLAGVDTLLELAITALVAAHPELESGAAINTERGPGSLWLAEVIVDAAATLRVYLDRYEGAVRRERQLASTPEDEISW